MKLSTIADWLTKISTLHPTEMELGLERIRPIAEIMKVLDLGCPIFIVGGTNGKGSTVAGLEAVYRAAGFNVGAFTSPIILKHNEQVRLNGENPADEVFCDAFAKVEAARGEISITPFEFYTLAALSIFKDSALDVVILEVGLGGRLDAVNIVDADVSIVTSIGIDHVEFLGPTRESIGFEKAGIFRKGRPAVCGDIDPPVTLIEHAQKLGAILYCQGKDFSYKNLGDSWSWQSADVKYSSLPMPTLALQNMSIVLMGITLLQKRLPVTEGNIADGLSKVSLTGRQQTIMGDVIEIRDVAHNVDSVTWLKEKLIKTPCAGKRYAVFSMLADKDIKSCVALIKDQIDEWHIAALDLKRGTPITKLEKIFAELDVNQITTYPTIQSAYQSVRKIAKKDDQIIVFGSFHTVAEVITLTASANQA